MFNIEKKKKLYFLDLFGDAILPTRNVLLSNFEYSNVYFFIVRPLRFKYIQMVTFNKLDKFVACICLRLSSLSILKVPYLLLEDSMVFML